ncbi:GNAT family N-acetyltransferase [Halosimplex halophilum]|uniref:GNAT family N-acetyltransferase n=1 Tax=Halosimplex halophilum TaxID=2559572 RepID=UPI00107F7BBD|nr:GNAT family N-acetyltransferase [Halosimplex halophilum]
MNFREATTSDTRVMSRIQREALLERAEGRYSPDQLRHMVAAESDREIVPEKRVSSEENRYVIVEDEGNPVGYGGISIGEGILLATFVEPSVADQGIGSRIVRHLHDIARDEGHENLRTYASLNAVEFYRKLGYTEVERTTVGEEGGPDIPSVLMKAPL